MFRRFAARATNGDQAPLGTAVTVRAIRLLRIELTVSELSPVERFYVEALGFETVGRSDLDRSQAALLGVERVHQVLLRRGDQSLALQAFRPPGDPYPERSAACDQVFQHFAMPVDDMRLAMARLLPFAPSAISSNGPQQLPEQSGGAIAYKFRDPAGHPLEFIQFPDRRAGGIDHSAIAVSNADRSMAFYDGELGLSVAARQINVGAEQDALDGLQGAKVTVVALTPEQSTPHIELLAYQAPQGQPSPPLRPRDVAATRLVLEVTGLPGPTPMLTHDPDGHALVLQPVSYRETR